MTLYRTVQIKLANLPSHSMLTLGPPVLALTLWCQAPCRVATRDTNFQVTGMNHPRKAGFDPSVCLSLMPYHLTSKAIWILWSTSENASFEKKSRTYCYALWVSQRRHYGWLVCRILYTCNSGSTRFLAKHGLSIMKNKCKSQLGLELWDFSMWHLWSWMLSHDRV